MEQQQQQQLAWPISINLNLQRPFAEGQDLVATDPNQFLGAFVRDKTQQVFDWMKSHFPVFLKLYAHNHPQMFQEWIQHNFAYNLENGEIVPVQESVMPSSNIETAQLALRHQMSTIVTTQASGMNGNIVRSSVIVRNPQGRIVTNEDHIRRIALQTFCANVANDSSELFKAFHRAKSIPLLKWINSITNIICKIFALLHQHMFEEWIRLKYPAIENDQIIRIQQFLSRVNSNIEAGILHDLFKQVPTVPDTQAEETQVEEIQVEEIPVEEIQVEETQAQNMNAGSGGMDFGAPDDAPRALNFDVPRPLNFDVPRPLNLDAPQNLTMPCVNLEEQRHVRILSRAQVNLGKANPKKSHRKRTKQQQLEAEREKRFRKAFKAETGRAFNANPYRFNLFRKDNPEMKVAQAKIAYKRLSPEVKAHYDQIHAKVKAEYDRDLEEFKRVRLPLLGCAIVLRRSANPFHCA